MNFTPDMTLEQGRKWLFERECRIGQRGTAPIAPMIEIEKNGNRYEFTSSWVYAYEIGEYEQHWFSANIRDFGKMITYQEIINRIENFAK